MKQKRAEGLAMQTVVVAAIVMVVLVVVLLIFKGGIPKNLDKFNQCQNDGSRCDLAANCGIGEVSIYGLGCEKDANGKDKTSLDVYCCKKEKTNE
jgi:hypothetical protein